MNLRRSFVCCDQFVALSFVVVTLFQFVVTFNVDLDSRVVHTLDDDDQRWFGFSVSMHIDAGIPWLLVGAPRAQTSQNGVTRGGAVYKCRPDGSSPCEIIPFDPFGNNYVTIAGEKVDSDNKTNQWFGATVHSSGTNGNIVACAPRYVHFSNNLKRIEPVGTCYVSRSSFSDFREYSPCRTKYWGYHREGYCQAGFSAGISEDGKSLYMGAIGSWYWQGQVYSQNLLHTVDKNNTNEDAQIYDTSYLGYSIALGEFSGDDKQDVVVGRPRGGNLTGQVLIYNSSLHSLFNISGEQIGSYFGYSVAAVDLNGDNLDDIIVGAPFFSNYSSKLKKFETGRVYIFYQTKTHKFRNWDYLDGSRSKGRFGLAVASLDSINKDGYGDLCVGAPYDGDSGRGVIYIYHGQKDGLNLKPTQIIRAEDIDDKISTFGFSLSGGLDLDGNKYPDILVGGYDSNKAVYLRSRPVVNLETSILFEPDFIDLGSKTCTLKGVNFTDVSCVVLLVCFEYSGFALNRDLAIRYRLVLDSNEDIPRLFFHKRKHQNTLSKSKWLQINTLKCDRHRVYVPNDIRDKLTPISISAVPELVRRPKRKTKNRKKVFPILNLNKDSSSNAKIYIFKECGKDNICIPDVSLNLTVNQDSYVVGQKTVLRFKFTINNIGENAYETMLFFWMSEFVDFVKVEDSSSEKYSSNCDGPKEGLQNLLKCDIGNPFLPNQSAEFTVLMTAKSITAGVSHFNFHAIINSTNPETNSTLYDNEISTKLPIQADSRLNTFGISTPSKVFFNESHFKEEKEIKSDKDIGPEILHTFGYSNLGLTPILTTSISILWPIETASKDPFLHLTYQPIVFGNGSCSTVPGIEEIDDKNRVLNVKSQYLRTLLSLSEFTKWNSDLSQHKLVRKTRSVDYLSYKSGELVPCEHALCIVINCTLHNIDHRTSFILLPGRLNTRTVGKLKAPKFSILSQSIAVVEKLPFNIDPSYLEPHLSEVTTEVFTGIERDWLWVIIVAVCLGLMLLVIIILILWKLGFFKRKRPQKQQEFQENNAYSAYGYHSPKEGDTCL